MRDVTSLGRWELREGDGGGFKVFGRPEEARNRQFVQNQSLRKKNCFFLFIKILKVFIFVSFIKIKQE